MKNIILCYLLFPMSVMASTSPLQYKPTLENASIQFFLPYTLGIHEGKVNQIEGKVVLDVNNLSEIKGEFSVPINSLTTGDRERDCHLQESLGLNYTVSDFPEKHVCDHNQLPASGKNAVVYPIIHFKVLKTKVLPEENSIEVEGEWTIHGVTHADQIKMKMIPEGKNIRLKGETKFSLKNYGIVVKSAKVLFVTISVKDELRLVLNLLLIP